MDATTRDEKRAERRRKRESILHYDEYTTTATLKALGFAEIQEENLEKNCKNGSVSASRDKGHSAIKDLELCKWIAKVRGLATKEKHDREHL